MRSSGTEATRESDDSVVPDRAVTSLQLHLPTNLVLDRRKEKR